MIITRSKQVRKEFEIVIEKEQSLEVDEVE